MADLDVNCSKHRTRRATQSLFMFGYAGWAPGQLEAEIKADSWFSIPGDKSLIFGKDAEGKWKQATARRQIPL
jgi:putative transcriptional regulator